MKSFSTEYICWCFSQAANWITSTWTENASVHFPQMLYNYDILVLVHVQRKRFIECFSSSHSFRLRAASILFSFSVFFSLSLLKKCRSISLLRSIRRNDSTLDWMNSRWKYCTEPKARIINFSINGAGIRALLANNRRIKRDLFTMQMVRNALLFQWFHIYRKVNIWAKHFLCMPSDFASLSLTQPFRFTECNSAFCGL